METTHTQLTISFEPSTETLLANMRVSLGGTDLLMPLPDGLHLEGSKSINLSLSLLTQSVFSKGTNAADPSSLPKPQAKQAASVLKQNNADKAPLIPAVARPQTTLSKYQTQWPVIGGDDLVLDTAEILSSSAYARQYQPGIKRDIYIAGCPGLKELKKQLNIPIFKVGDCGEGRITDRIKQHNKDQYGSYHKIAGHWPVQDDGYDEYAALQVYLPRDLHKMSPVRALKRGLTVTLPRGMNRQQFSHGLQRVVLQTFQ